ncbi:MAG TPA: hypothetical protein VMJ75_12350 [Candidatus Acidoferrales bacterium]|nr:hypothetical protein [Candidatus Acidoferrales bacterium]
MSRMLVIRDAQMEALAQSLRDAFEKRARAHLRDLFPEDCAELSEGPLGDRIRESIARAQSYGLMSEDELLTFLEQVFILGPDFDNQYAWAREVLTHDRMGPATKAELLTRLTDQYLGVTED